MNALGSGRRIKYVTCVDDYTKEYLTITTAFGITNVQVTAFWTDWTIPWLSGDDKNRSGPGIYLPRSINRPLRMVLSYD